MIAMVLQVAGAVNLFQLEIGQKPSTTTSTRTCASTQTYSWARTRCLLILPIPICGLQTWYNGNRNQEGYENARMVGIYSDLCGVPGTDALGASCPGDFNLNGPILPRRVSTHLGSARRHAAGIARTDPKIGIRGSADGISASLALRLMRKTRKIQSRSRGCPQDFIGNR